MDKNEFWDMTSRERLHAEYDVDEKLAYLQTASIETLRTVFHEYRFFIKYFINDLGLLTYRIPFSRLKCVIAEITHDELGNDPQHTHLQLWDNFLMSLGTNESELENSHTPANIEMMEQLSELVLSEPYMYAVGLRGMGGECLCQVYLTSTYNHLMKNPNILAMKDEIDWVFWDIHTGEEDIHHVDMVREAIDELLCTLPASAVDELSAGFYKGKDSWDKFWTNLHQAIGLTPELSTS